MTQAIPLGVEIPYPTAYDAKQLFPVSRQSQRIALGLGHSMPFVGFDVWNGYEISWLNSKGKPQVAVAEFVFPCESPRLIESKSFKLYLNSFNDTKFSSPLDVIHAMERDLAAASGAVVQVHLTPVHEFTPQTMQQWQGTLLDQLDIECTEYEVNPKILQTEKHKAQETLISHLLKSNCLVTGQPDWASLRIVYQGQKIQHESLLQYIVSYRHHAGFHESCVEQIFMDILRECKPQSLYIEARYTRRGGLDINPVRATSLDKLPPNLRLCRQ